MTTDLLPILTVPARHLQCGDHFNGMVVSQWQRIEGRYQWTLAVPYTTHIMKLEVREEDLDSVSFPITKRGDDYSPNARNAALGLPLVAPKPYVAPEPIAVYRAGTKMSDVKHFDRGQHVQFRCPLHPETRYSSKDPYVSSWFHDPAVGECPPECPSRADDMIVTVDYLPTRNG